MDIRSRSLSLVWKRVPTAIGVAVLVAGVAEGQAPEPAAKLRPPVPITLQDGPLITRGLSPEARPFDPTRGPLPSEPATSVKPTAGWPGAPKPAVAVTRAPWAAPKQPSMLESAWSDVKEFVTGKPTDPVVLQQSPYTFTNPTATANPQAPRPGTAGVYAGPPAYRWYGWGTTTPGTNPYAPAGQYPRGSGNWYAQTGATPGAFPVPVSAPRFTFGSEPPSYVGVTNTLPMPIEPLVYPLARPVVAHERVPTVIEYPMSAVSVQPPAGGALAPLSTIPVPPHGPAMPVPEYKPLDAAPSVPTGQPIPLPVVPSGAVSEFPAADSISWQRSGGAGEPIPFTPVGEAKPPAQNGEWSPSAPSAAPIVIQPASAVRTGEPAGKKPSPLEMAVRSACQGTTTVTDFRVIGPNRLSVELAAATQADARAAFEKVSQHPQLKPYEVQFEVKLTGR